MLTPPTEPELPAQGKTAIRQLRERWRRRRERKKRLNAARYATGYTKDAGPGGAGGG